MKTLKRLVTIGIAICLTISSLYGLSHIVRPYDTDDAYTQIETLHSLPENSVEVMVYGSSRAFRGMNPMEMYENYGIGCYNYAWHWQKINTIKLFLEDSLMVQAPKVILIDTSHVNEVLHDCDMNAEIYYSRYIKNKEAKNKYLEQCFGSDVRRYLGYYFPLYAFHENWKDMKERSFQPVSRTMGRLIRTMGFSPSDTIIQVEIPKFEDIGQEELSRDAIKELDDIVRICGEKDIEIIFYTPPWEHEYPFCDAMTRYASENDCVYFDFFKDFDKVGLDEATDFSDNGHLNTSGANKLSNYIGKFIVDNYDVTDMRSIENNIWEENLKDETDR